MARSTLLDIFRSLDNGVVTLERSPVEQVICVYNLSVSFHNPDYHRSVLDDVQLSPSSVKEV